MTVISSTTNPEALSLTLVTEFDADVERVWQIWEDPRQLERWWGPPGYPATFEKHEFTPGGEAGYYMTTPEGEKPRGWWRFTRIERPNRLELEDGFADENGEPVESIGSGQVIVTLEDIGGRTRMTIQNNFASEEQMTTMLQMGMEEGMKEAAGQIDDLLAEHSRA
ncbi:polyketide cyclase [Arthrobacter sp. SW1]|uniref:SRPBCC family protein n=1 Tax=Arthrobacter sp. SW1 TaxID=1920889 RepID=UPI000877B765|nr:SRPBCC domain-containing protein [Arthrobacter sp. SW1]OFI37133.1 polyketide cyclase [Arthrobacter sp. SW1]